MKTKILIGILVLMLATPAVSHGFGLFRYVFDAVYNQLGLDRGPIPKIFPQPMQPGPHPSDLPQARQSRYPKIYIQAEGF